MGHCCYISKVNSPSRSHGGGGGRGGTTTKVRVRTTNLLTCSRDEFSSVPEDEMVHSGDAFPFLEATHDHYMTYTVATFCTVD